MLEQAISISAMAHAGQTDKAGDPYVLHPIRVMLRVSSYEERIVAVLHDVLEDTSITIEYLRTQGFSNEVLEALTLLTKTYDAYMDYIMKIKKNKLAHTVKLADITDNLDPIRLAKLSSRVRESLKTKYSLALEMLSEKPEIEQKQ